MTGQAASAARTIYIAGLGRSGSTVLGSCLGAPSGSIAIGEAYYLWSRGLGGQSDCGCLRPVAECPFWAPVLDRVSEQLGGATLAEMAKRADHAPRLRHVRRLVRDPSRLQRDHGPYLELRLALHRALASTGHHTIVDSSKRASELLVLAAIPEIAAELTVVHLVRHPARTAASWAKPKPDASRVEGALTPIGPTSSLAWWYWWNRSIRAVSATLAEPPILINWEDVADDPGPMLAKVLGPEARDEILAGPNRVLVEPSHQIDGNPSKLDDAAGTIDLRPDNVPARLSTGPRLLLRREMARLGYRGSERC